MSNSFDINVKPEISEVAADIAANLVQILSNASALATIQITDLPAIDALIDIIDTNIDAIIDPKLPDILTAVGDNAAKIDLIQTDQYFSVTASDVEVGAADTERSTGNTVYEESKVIQIIYSGIYRITFDLKTNHTDSIAYAKLYKDGVSFGTEQTNGTVDYVNKSEDLYFAAGELCQLYIKTATGPYEVYVQNFKVKGTGDILKAYPITD